MIREKLLPVESYAVFDSFTEKALQDGEEGVEQPESLLHAKNWLFYKGRLRRWFFFPNDGMVMFLVLTGALIVIVCYYWSVAGNFFQNLSISANIAIMNDVL